MSRLDRECSVDSCVRTQTARGWCSTHYYRWKRTGDVQADKPLSRVSNRDLPASYEKGSRCSVEGCENFERARGWCMAHYSRWKRLGDVQADKPLKGAVIVSTQVCSVGTCTRPAHAKTLCESHYVRSRTGLPMDTPLRRMSDEVPLLGDGDAPCTWGECGNAARYSGLCRWHFRYAAEQEHPEVTLTTLRARQGDECFYCGCPMIFVKTSKYDPDRASVEHKIPLVSGGKHTFDNCVLACRRCNTRKRNFSMVDWVSFEVALSEPVYSESSLQRMLQKVGD